MENIIRNIKDGMTIGDHPGVSGFELARVLANENQEKTGNETFVRRIVDYIDTHNDRQRENCSFDVVEIRTRGGVREGAGRPELNPLLKKRQVGLQLPEWMIAKLDEMDEPRQAIIEQALIDNFGWTPPVVD